MDELTTFPKLSELRVSHKPVLESVCNPLAPYSDFDFTSLYSWDFDNSTKVAKLNGNLVVSMPDYVTGDLIYTMIGTNQIDETLERLLDVSDTLSLIPEDVIKLIKRPERFLITEDVDSADYIFSHEALANLPGSEYHAKRKMINRFERQYEGQYRVERIDFADTDAHKRIVDTFSRWAIERARSHKEVSNEFRAIKRLLSVSGKLDLIGVELFINDQPMGFSIHEAISDTFTVCHFHKTILNHVGVDVFLTVYAARVLHKAGYQYENWEQDLGITGLRELKRSYHPVSMLKKYKVRRAAAHS